MNFPRVLIFGQPFNKRQGGGITLSNLFRGWDKANIAVVATGHAMSGIDTEICDKYYQLGNEEYVWRFPFNLFQRKYRSGLVKFNNNNGLTNRTKKSRIRHLLVIKYFYPVLEWLGLYHNAAEIRLTDRFRKWLLEFSPEIIYLQVYSFDTIKFANLLIHTVNVPSIIHMMDDWPSTISSKGPFKKYWFKKIDKEFRYLLDNINLFLSISDAMSEEYQKRYGKIFLPFHNPIDIERFVINPLENITTYSYFKILYLGRIGTANKNALLRFAAFITDYQYSGYTVELDIYTINVDDPFVRKIKKLSKVNVKNAVTHSEVPRIMKEYQLLLLPLDFTKSGFRFSRFSIPTKASEFMASGIPIIIFAPAKTAISRFCLNNNCGHCISSQDDQVLKENLDMLIRDSDYRKRLSKTAVKLAHQLFDGEKRRTEFRQLLINLIQVQDHV